MKKSYLLGMFALAAMTMVGCSNDEVVNDYSQDNAIQFGTYVGRNASSRAHEITTEVLAKEGFGVFAYYHPGTEDGQAGTFSPNSEPDFMYNQWVRGEASTTGEGESATTTYSTKNWTYAPVKYWPNNVNDRVSFFAYAPYNKDLTLGEDAAGDPIYPYVVEVNEANNIATSNNDVDLLYLQKPMLNVQKQLIEEKVTFTFEHALSRIAFAAKVLVDEVNGNQTGTENGDEHTTVSLANGTIITINSVKINGKFYTAGELNLNRPPLVNNKLQTGWLANKFTASTNVISYELIEENFVENANVFEGATVKTEGLLNDDESYLMIMPQNFGEDNEITITVDYDVVTTDEKNELNSSEINNVITSVPFTFNFEEGKAYKFTLHLGMTSVKLSASVTPWADGEDWSVNVPINNDSKGENGKGTGNPEWDKYYGNETSEGGNQGGDIEEGE